MKDDQAWRVLLVDDDEDDYLLTWIMLSEAKGRKIEFEWAKNYQQGSEMIRSKQFDAILVDYDLGPTSGIAFIREHESRDSQTPFILYTGRGSYDIDVEALEAGATLYLPKSEATPLQLERSIRYAIEHKRTEEALRISEERFSKAFRASPDGLAITRQADGRIIEVNDSFEKVLGYSCQEVIGKSPGELGLYVDPHDRQNARSQLQEKGSIRDLELQLRAKSGELRHVTISVEAIVVNDEPCYLTILRDITEQMRAGQALRESEERFRVALQYAPIMVFHYDQDMRYTWAFNTHPDFPPEMLIGKTDAELVPGELGRELTEFKRQVFETGMGTRREVSIALSDGQHTFDLSAEPMRDAQGTVIGVTAAAMDITERKQAEKEMQTLTQALPQLVWTSLPDGQIDFCNDRWLSYTGLSAGEVFGDGWAKALHPEDHASTFQAWNQAVASGGEYQVEQRLRSSDGDYRWFLARAVPFQDETGQIVRWYGTCTDIDDQKQTAAALERERELLRRLFDRIPVMIAIYRPDTRVVQLNPAFERLTGWTTEEASQVDFMEKCYPDPEYRQTVGAFMESLQEGWMDIDMTTRDGTILHSSWSNIRLSDDTQVGIGIDIRDRKRAEEILKKAAKQFEKRDLDLEEFTRLDGGISPEAAG